jgi:hypothetical protein
MQVPPSCFVQELLHIEEQETEDVILQALPDGSMIYVSITIERLHNLLPPLSLRLIGDLAVDPEARSCMIRRCTAGCAACRYLWPWHSFLPVFQAISWKDSSLSKFRGEVGDH